MDPRRGGGGASWYHRRRAALSLPACKMVGDPRGSNAHFDTMVTRAPFQTTRLAADRTRGAGHSSPRTPLAVHNHRRRRTRAWLWPVEEPGGSPDPWVRPSNKPRGSRSPERCKRPRGRPRIGELFRVIPLFLRKSAGAHAMGLFGPRGPAKREKI